MKKYLIVFGSMSSVITTDYTSFLNDWIECECEIFQFCEGEYFIYDGLDSYDQPIWVKL